MAPRAACAALAIVASILLSGCGSFESPWGILVSKDDSAIVTAPLPPGADRYDADRTSGPTFRITTGVNGDPRDEAQNYCAKHSSYYARLVATERVAGATLAEPRIRWYFDCAI